MTLYDLEDDFGQHTKFEGERLVHHSTDTDEHDKPRWKEMQVYRTVGGRYVVWDLTIFRISHSDPHCRKVPAGDIVDLTDEDTIGCPMCNRYNDKGRYGQAARVKVDSWVTPEELIQRMSVIDPQTGLRTHTTFGREVLALVSEVEPEVEELWMNQVIS